VNNAQFPVARKISRMHCQKLVNVMDVHARGLSGIMNLHALHFMRDK